MALHETTVEALLASARAVLGHRPTPPEAAEELANGALLIDIRGDDQRRHDGVIPGAVAVPRNSLEWRCDPTSAWRDPAITDHERRVMLICNEGFQSSLAAATLRRLGIANATDVDGGFQAWRAAGLPVDLRGRRDVDTGGQRARRSRVADHWETAFTRHPVDSLSWYQREPAVSLQLLDQLGVERDAEIVDVGGGGSALIPALAARGFRDLTVVDVSESALEASRDRLGSDARHVRLVRRDVLAWKPTRRYAAWHDRALLHFLVDPSARMRYVDVLRRAVGVRGAVVIGVFAADGPSTCSGLPVMRYAPAQQAALLGDEFELVADRREAHVTPTGAVQPFQWSAFRRLEQS